MSWGIDITEKKEDIVAKLQQEKERLTPLLANLPTEQEDMQGVLNRAMQYAEGLDLDVYNKTWGSPSYQANAIRVQASGSQSSVGTPPQVTSASFSLVVSASKL